VLERIVDLDLDELVVGEHVGGHEAAVRARRVPVGQADKPVPKRAAGLRACLVAIEVLEARAREGGAHVREAELLQVIKLRRDVGAARSGRAATAGSSGAAAARAVVSAAHE